LSARFLLAAALAASFCARAQELERAPFITTPEDVVQRMLGFAGTTPNDLVVDLGSGDGRIVIAAAKRFGARGLGIELDPVLVEKSRDAARAAGVADRVSIVHGNVLFADISRATVVTVYLLPGLINQLQPRLLNELQPGSRIVSHAFAMAGWKPDRSETMRVAAPRQGQTADSTLFLWIVPAKVRGTWRGDGLYLSISQNFQEIDVDARLEGKPLSAVRGTLRGDRITWEASEARFAGSIDANRMDGELVHKSQARRVTLNRSR
jgi:precorrin-6B methylase 2